MTGTLLCGIVPLISGKSALQVRVREKGRVTLPSKLRELLGIRVGDLLVVEPRENAIVLKPQGKTVEESWGIVKTRRVVLEEIEESLGRTA